MEIHASIYFTLHVSDAVKDLFTISEKLQHKQNNNSIRILKMQKTTESNGATIECE